MNRCAARERAEAAAWRGAPRRASLVPVVGSAAEWLREPSPLRRRSLVVVVRPPQAGPRAHGNPESGCGTQPRWSAQRSRVRHVGHRPPAAARSDGPDSNCSVCCRKMFVGGLSWQTSPGTLAGNRECIRCGRWRRPPVSRRNTFNSLIGTLFAISVMY